MNWQKDRKKEKQLEDKDVLPNKPHTGRQKGENAVFVPGDLDL